MAADKPQSRSEEILTAIINREEYNKPPQSRIEELLLELKAAIEEGSGTDDYEDLENKPQIGGTTLIGNKSLGDLGIKNEFVGTLEEWNQLTTEEKKAFDTYQITDDYTEGGGGGGSFVVKTKKYTGTGTVSIEHDFGDETPKVILGISIDPEYNNGNYDFATILCFPWGCKLTAMNWAVGSNNYPVATGNGGGWRVALTYEGNKMTVYGHDAGAACNRTGAEYVIWYV